MTFTVYRGADGRYFAHAEAMGAVAAGSVKWGAFEALEPASHAVNLLNADWYPTSTIERELRIIQRSIEQILLMLNVKTTFESETKATLARIETTSQALLDYFTKAVGVKIQVDTPTQK